MILHPGEERVSLYPAKRQAPVAQWIEHLITVQKVGGSSPFGRAAAPLGAIHRWGFCISTKHSLRECFFHAHPSVAFPAGRFPIRPDTKAAQQLASLTGGATERARHGSFRTAPRQSSPCSPEMGHLGPLTRRSAGVRAIYRVGTRNNGLTCEHTHLARHRCAQNVDHLAHNALFSAYFAEVICTLGAIPSHVGDSP